MWGSWGLMPRVRAGRCNTSPSGAGRLRGPPKGYAGAGNPVSAVTTGSRAWLISSPMERKKVMGAP